MKSTQSCRHPAGCTCEHCAPKPDPRSLHAEMDRYTAEFDKGVRGVRAEMDRVVAELDRRVRELKG